MKLAEVYKVIKEMDSSILGGGTPTDTLNTADTFAPGDNRIPAVLGKIQRRIGGNRKKRKSKKLKR